MGKLKTFRIVFCNPTSGCFISGMILTGKVILDLTEPMDMTSKLPPLDSKQSHDSLRLCNMVYVCAILTLFLFIGP